MGTSSYCRILLKCETGLRLLDGCNRKPYYVDVKDLRNIYELRSQIASKYGISEHHLYMFLQNSELDDDESIKVLKNNDVLQLIVTSEPNPIFALTSTGSIGLSQNVTTASQLLQIDAMSQYSTEQQGLQNALAQDSLEQTLQDIPMSQCFSNQAAQSQLTLSQVSESQITAQFMSCSLLPHPSQPTHNQEGSILSSESETPSLPEN